MTKEIKLSKGFMTLVDDVDFEYLNQWKWYCNVHGELKYAVRKVNNGDGTWTRFLMHRILAKTPKNKITDHIDGNGLNNQKSNLRNVSRRENTLNRKLQKSTPSGRAGVKISTWKGHWEAHIGVKGKYIHLGTFSNKEDAVRARIAGEKLYFGEFLRQESL